MVNRCLPHSIADLSCIALATTYRDLGRWHRRVSIRINANLDLYTRHPGRACGQLGVFSGAPEMFPRERLTPKDRGMGGGGGSTLRVRLARGRSRGNVRAALRAKAVVAIQLRADERRVCSLARPGRRRASLAPRVGARFPTLAAFDQHGTMKRCLRVTPSGGLAGGSMRCWLVAC